MARTGTRASREARGEARLTRRDLLARHVAITGAGLLAGQALAAPALTLAADAPGGVALHPRFYPRPDFVADISLSGKLAVVTGASTGIGRAVGEALRDQGVSVIGTSRNAARVRDRPPFALWNLDVADPESIEAFARRLRRKLGRRSVDILVNNAGRGIAGEALPPAGDEELYFERLGLGLRTDYIGQVMVTRSIVPLMPRRGYARVAFTGTIAAYSVATGVMTYLNGYVSAKRALLAFANAWRTQLEQARSNIRVFTVNPYQVDTRFVREMILTQPAPAGSALAAYIEALRRAFAAGLPPSLVGEAYVQLLRLENPPANVAAGSSQEPYATMGNTALFNATILAENAQGAAEFV